MRWAEHVARMGEKRNAYRLLVGKPEGKRPLGRSNCRWVDNIKMDLLEIGWGGVDWIRLAQDRDKWRALVNAVMNLRVQKNAWKLSSGYPIQLVSSRVVLSSVELVGYYVQCFENHLLLLWLNIALCWALAVLSVL
jgi:hypothetical protein